MKLHHLKWHAVMPVHQFVHVFACAVLLSVLFVRVFLTLLCFGGIFGLFWLCVFLVVIPYFANFWIFSIFENFSIWLVFVLSCLQV